MAAGVVAAGLWLYAPVWELALRSDKSPVAWLSSAQLWAASLLALRLGAEGALPKRWSAWLGLSMAALALDEQFLLHERWKFGCYEWLLACGHHAWLRELPMPAVAVVGACSVAGLYRLLAGQALARSLFVAALAVGLVAIGIDQLPVPPALGLWEEAFEVGAEALFLAALLAVDIRQA